MKHTLRFIKSYLQLHISTAMEYRFNFILQSTFMIVNNTLFALFWYFLFTKVDTINGWMLKDFVLLFGMGAMNYGIMSFFMGNWLYLHDLIASGRFDFYLALPKNPLLHALISKSIFSGFGDIIFGTAIYFLFAPLSLQTAAIYFIGSILGSIIWLNITIATSALTFWRGNIAGIADAMKNILLSTTSYPYIIYGPVIKFIFFFIIPAFFVTNVPVMLIQEFRWEWLIGFLAVTILTSMIAEKLFKRGIRHYESGNLLTTRT